MSTLTVTCSSLALISYVSSDSLAMAFSRLAVRTNQNFALRLIGDNPLQSHRHGLLLHDSWAHTRGAQLSCGSSSRKPARTCTQLKAGPRAYAPTSYSALNFNLYRAVLPCLSVRLSVCDVEVFGSYSLG